jgi:hypothetical protein
MRSLLALSCRAFPADHRARQSDEVVDTALLAADGSARRAAREALSLVVAGAQQRLRAESRRSLRDGVGLLAGVLAVVNLAVALAGITAAVGAGTTYFVDLGTFASGYLPYVVDWWWIAFTGAAALVIVGLVLGSRPIAAGAAFVNLALVGYDALFLADGNPYDGKGHLDVFTYAQTSSFPAGRGWLLPSVLLALATATATLRRVPLTRLPLALGGVVLLVVLSRETWGAFFFLRWPLAALILLAVAFGAVAPRLAVLAAGVTLAVVPSAIGYLTAPNLHHDPAVTVVVAAGLALGLLLPLAQLTRRRLT